LCVLRRDARAHGSMHDAAMTLSNHDRVCWLNDVRLKGISMRIHYCDGLKTEAHRRLYSPQEIAILVTAFVKHHGVLSTILTNAMTSTKAGCVVAPLVI